MSFFTKIKKYFQKPNKAAEETKPVAEANSHLHISVSDKGQTFRNTGGYQYRSHIPNSGKDTDN